MKQLWTEKYRPNKLDEYVFKSKEHKVLVNQWLTNGIPNILLSGAPGIGKTSLALMMLKEKNVCSGDILFVNASKERKVDDLLPKIDQFSQTFSMSGDLKYVILDEADAISQVSQKALRGMIEQYSSVCRFILTANYPNKIIPALISRLQHLHIEHLDQTSFITRASEVLISENVEIDIDALEFIIEKSYPDLRKCISVLQQYSINGVLVKPEDNITSNKDYLLTFFQLFKEGRVTEARKLLIDQIDIEEYESVYTWLYTNIEDLFDDEKKQNEAILIIRKGLCNHTLCADPEINLAACIVEMGLI